MPQEDLIYVADSAYTPYGDRNEFEIEQRVSLIASFLYQQKVKAIVVACNTATAAAISQLRTQYQFPIIGLEPALKPAIEYSPNKRVGVLATQATLNSQKYLTLKSSLAGELGIFEKASPLFVQLVEDCEQLSSHEVQLIESELDFFKNAEVDSLVLGCTHYPFLTDTISQIMGNQVRIFESSQAVANELKRRLNRQINLETHQGLNQFYSTHPQSAQKKFNRILGQRVKLLELTLE